MKKLLSTMTALSALAAAAPAAAGQGNYPQYPQNGYSQRGYANVNAGGAVGIQNRIYQLQNRLQAGVQAGTITRGEARALEPQLRQLRDIERQYSANGLTQWERQDLQQRIRYVRQQLRAADDRGGQYADSDDDRFDDDGGYRDNRYNPGRSARYDDRYNNGNWGQGGPYEEVNQVCGERSGGGGIGGIIGSIFGAGNNCLSVGQRVSGNLYGLPYELRDQFRDGGGYYHRYVNGRVVQIDARTQTVVRIYDVQD